jgi:phospholipid transport system substrate-binding protein
LLALTIAVPAYAGETTAEGFMKEKQTELAALDKKGGAESQKKMESVFDSILDYDSLAQSSLRDHWGELTEAERKEFQETLKKLVQRAYRKNLDRTMDYDVRFEGETKEGESFLVHTTAQSRSNAREEPISIDYLLHRPTGPYLIQDIVTEGSSLVSNYQQQFNRIIKKEGFSGLMKRMKIKLAKGTE